MNAKVFAKTLLSRSHSLELNKTESQLKLLLQLHNGLEKYSKVLANGIETDEL